MPEYLEFNIDKFNFRVATDRYYNETGVWAKWEGLHVIIGMSDYLQQRSGDVAFAEIKPSGTQVKFDEEVATIETIKVNISLPCPVSGQVISVNPKMSATPEIINQDPYGEGWLAVISLMDFPVQMKQLLDARSYYEKIKLEAQRESRK
jgi:glycine cleavage system H protein